MEGPILGFVRALRASGVRVGTSEVADALAAAVAVGVEDRDVFRAALRATLVKRSLDTEAFDELFPLHFSPFGAAGTAPPPNTEDGPGLRPLPQGAMEELGDELQRLVDRVMESSDVELALMVREAGRDILRSLESMLQQGMAARSIMEALGAGGADAALDRFAAQLRAQGFAEEEARAWRDRLRDELERLRATVRGVVREHWERSEAERRRERSAAEIGRTAIGAVSDREAAELRRLVERLGRRLDQLPELRRRRHRRGSLDLQRTWRANIATGAMPFHLELRRPPRRKPQVIAICDISSSMQTTVRFLLHFLYRLQDRFSRVRTFVAVSDVLEVTDAFREGAVATAIEHAMEPPDFAWYAATNYGRIFERFLAKYPDAVTSRTVVLILGDGRSNHTPPRAHLLDEIGRRSRRLVWLNPETRLSWGLGDSAMPHYVPHCTEVAEIRTVAQLEAAIDAIAGVPRR